MQLCVNKPGVHTHVHVHLCLLCLVLQDSLGRNMDGIGGTAIIFAFGTWLVGQAAVLFAGVDALDCSAFPQGPLESSCKNNKLGAGFAGFFLLIGFFVCTAGSILHLKPPPASHAGVGGFAAGFGFLLLSKATLGFALANEPGACKSGDVASLDSNSKICAASVSSGLFDLFGFVVVLGGVALSLAKKDTSGIVAGCAFGLCMLLLADVGGGTLSGAIGLFQLYDSDQCDSKLCKGALAAGLFWGLGALVCLACSVAHMVKGHREGSSSAANPPTGTSTAVQEAELSPPTGLTAATPGICLVRAACVSTNVWLTWWQTQVAQAVWRLFWATFRCMPTANAEG